MDNFNNALRKLDLKFYEKILRAYGDEYVKNLKYYITIRKKIATGKLLNSIDYRIMKNVDILVIKLIAMPYLEEVDKGIIKNDVKQRDIKDWVQVKNIKFLNKGAHFGSKSDYLDDDEVARLITNKLNRTKKMSRDKKWNNPSNIIKDAQQKTLNGNKKFNKLFDDINIKKMILGFLEDDIKEVINNKK